jgi:hypothetical protein
VTTAGAARPASLKILLLCDYRPFAAAMVTDHINALHDLSAHEVFVFSSPVALGGELPADLDLDEFDAVVVHYSLFLAIDAYVSPRTRRRLAAYRGIKVAFIQDEYRFVDATVRRLQEIGFDLLFTCVPQAAIEKVYPAASLPGLRCVTTLTGFVPAALLAYTPLRLRQRRLDVSYRGRKYPLWHGRLGLEKWQLAERFRAEARRAGLRVDISHHERDRLYGPAWPALIQASRAVLGVESGASVFDFDGGIAARVETWQALLPEKQVDYAAVRAQHFADREDAIDLAQISPRIFEAMALRTACILYEGHYSGILVPERHYLPLRKDHRNFRDVVALLRDDFALSRIITDAYAEIACNERWSFATFVARFDAELATVAAGRESRREHPHPRFADRQAFHQSYPFYRVANPYAVAAPAAQRLLSRLAGRAPRWLRQRARRLLGVADALRGRV